MRGAPHYGFSRLSCRIKLRTSFETAGLPAYPRRVFHVQNSRKPSRCHAITVSGLTIASAGRQSSHARDNHTQKKSVAGGQFRPLHGPLQDTELVSEREILQLKDCSGFARRSRCNGEKANGIDSRAEEVQNRAQVPWSHSVRGLR